MTHASSTLVAAGGVGAPASLQDGVAEALERLTAVLLQRAIDPLQADVDAGETEAETDTARIRDRVRFLGQVAAGWPQLPGDAFPLRGAGFGSSVIVEDLDTGTVETCTLMAGPLLDFEAGQVSLASPIGQALLGATPGARVAAETPQRLRRLRVLSVRTLHDLLEMAMRDA